MVMGLLPWQEHMTGRLPEEVVSQPRQWELQWTVARGWQEP